MSWIKKIGFCVQFLTLLTQFEQLSAQSATQVFSVNFQPVFSGQKIVLSTPIFDNKGDSVVIETLRFYVGNFEFWKGGQVVLSQKSHHLIDLDVEMSLSLEFPVSEAMDFDSLLFDFGVDSATQMAGAMGGDLDPTRGMFWTWQSGYIHCKIEGNASQCPARGGAFEFHLGGYASPFSTIQKIKVNLTGQQSAATTQINLDLAPFFEQVDWAKKPSIMSPSSEAVRLSKVLAKSFRGHEN
jgi:hypothetical protein